MIIQPLLGTIVLSIHSETGGLGQLIHMDFQINHLDKSAYLLVLRKTN